MRVARLLTIGTTVFLSFILIVFINRGLDLSDEGFYLLKLKQINQQDIDIITFHKAYNMLFGCLEVNIINVRIIRLVLSVFSSALLAFGIVKYLQIKSFQITKESKWFVYSLIITGGYMGYGFGPQSLSYNSLTGYLLVITFALLLIFLGLKGSYRSIKVLFSVAIGFLSMMVFFSKVPSGIVLIMLLFILVFAFNKKIKDQILFIFGFLSGLAIAAMFFSFINQNFFVELKQFFKAKEITQSFSEELSNAGLLMNFARSAIMVIVTFLASWLVVIIFRRFYKIFSVLFKGYLGIFLLFIFTSAAYWTFASRSVFLIPVSIIIIYTIYEYIATSKNSFKYVTLTDIVLFIFFLIGPFITTLGTSFTMYNSTVFSVALWFGLLATSILLSNNIILNNILITVTVSLSLVYIIHNHIMYPYRINSLFEQTISIGTINDNERIKVDRETYDFLSNTKNALISHDYMQGDTILGVSKMNGVIYLMNGYSLGGSSWGGPYTTNILVENIKNNLSYGQFPKFFMYRGFSIENLDKDAAVSVLKTNGFPMANYSCVANIGKVPGDTKGLFLFKLDKP